MVATMAIEHEDIMELKRVFDDRYVLQHDCNDTQERINKKLANDDKRIDRIINRVAIWEKLLWAIASASIGALVLSFFELILK